MGVGEGVVPGCQTAHAHAPAPALQTSAIRWLEQGQVMKPPTKAEFSLCECIKYTSFRDPVCWVSLGEGKA